MKFYNPFKLHIIGIDDKFYVRKLTIFGCKYLDNDGSTYFWYIDSGNFYVKFNTLEKAKLALVAYPELIKNENKKTKVIHYD